MPVSIESIVADLSAAAARAAATEAAGRAELAAAPTVAAIRGSADDGAKICFDVRKVNLELLGHGGASGLSRFVATVRDDLGPDPVVLGIVGKDYEVVPMRTVIDQADIGLRQALGDTLVDRAKVRDLTSFSGAHVYRRYTIPTGETIEHARQARVRGTSVAFEVVIGNSFDGRSVVSLSAGSLDLICTNGAVAFVKQASASRRHTKSAAFYDWRSVVESALASYKDQIRKARVWAQTTITEAEARARLERLKIGPRSLEALLRQYQVEAENRGPTLWALASAMTYDATHGNLRQTGADHAATTILQRQVEVARDMLRVTA